MKSMMKSLHFVRENICAKIRLLSGGLSFNPNGETMHATLNPTAQPTGSRRLTLTMLAARDQADQFKGVPRGTANVFRFLAAFQEAEPYLGLPPQCFKLVSWLAKQTMAADWEQGSRPICWPSALRQAEFLGLSPARVKVLNRALFEAGIFIIRDSETGKRYGRRNADGRIIEAFGFDLSPLAYRFDEFVRIAAEARAERDRVRALKKRATCARRAFDQAGETLAAAQALPAEWAPLAAEKADLVRSIRRARGSADLAVVVTGIERQRDQAESWLRAISKPIEKDPEGLVSKPHTISTNKPFDSNNTVIASEESRAGGDTNAGSRTLGPVSSNTAGQASRFEPSDQIKLNPSELLELAPRLRDHVAQPYPSWPDVVDAAGASLRIDLGVSQPLWGDACQVLGRKKAAVALAIVSTKPRDYFKRGAGGYFAAMIKRAKTGELHLDRSIWKLRRDKWGGGGSSVAKQDHAW
jgi:replication initiation protein RepC